MTDQVHWAPRTKNEVGETFMRLRMDVVDALSHESLEDLYRVAAQLVAATRSGDWSRRYGEGVEEVRALAEREFARTARALNERARALGTKADFEERWSEAAARSRA